MNANDIRTAFREQFGIERYRRFIHQIARDSPERDELRFWQDRCWREFVVGFPDAPIEMNDVRDLFLWCYVHGQSLEPLCGRIALQDIRKPNGWHKALEESFPFSCGSCICPKCSLALKEWIANHDCEILRRRTDWNSYRNAHENDTTSEVLKQGQRALWEGEAGWRAGAFVFCLLEAREWCGGMRLSRL